MPKKKTAIISGTDGFEEKENETLRIGDSRERMPERITAILPGTDNLKREKNDRKRFQRGFL